MDNKKSLTLNQMLTTGQIAKQTGFLESKIDYVTRSRGIMESARVGTMRLFGPEAVKQIQKALQQLGADGRTRRARAAKAAAV